VMGKNVNYHGSFFCSKNKEFVASMNLEYCWVAALRDISLRPFNTKNDDTLIYDMKYEKTELLFPSGKGIGSNLRSLTSLSLPDGTQDHRPKLTNSPRSNQQPF
jgi:hypothetical protein